MFKEQWQTVHRGFHSASKFPKTSMWVTAPCGPKCAVVLHNSTVTSINRACLVRKLREGLVALSCDPSLSSFEFWLPRYWRMG